MQMDDLSFEEAFEELQDVVRKLEAGNLSLDESIVLFQRGMKLAQYCGEMLDKAELVVSQLLPSSQGEYEAVPFVEEA